MTTMNSFLTLLLMLVTPGLGYTTYNYLGFGSNMVPETMTALRQLTPLSYQAAVLPDYRLTFSIPGVSKIEPSAAAVEEDLGNEVVHGVLYELTEQDFAKVGSTEGVPFAYRWQRCYVHPYVGDGNQAGRHAIESVDPVEAFTLVSSRRPPSGRRSKDIAPSRSYRNLLIQGAKQFQMDSDYLHQLENTPCATDLLIPDGLAQKALDIAVFRKQLFGK